MTAKAAAPKKLIHVPVKDVKPDPDQPRKEFDQDEHLSLVESIKTFGVLTPISVRENGKGFVIVAGERRWRAAKDAKLTTIPAQVVGADHRLAASTVENVVRHDLNVIEEGDAYRNIAADEKLDAAGVAKLVSRPVERVERYMALAALPETARQAVIDGKLRVGDALNLTTGDEQLTRFLVAVCEHTGWQHSDPSWLLSQSERLDPSKQHVDCPKCEGEGYLLDGKPAVADDLDDDQWEAAVECPECEGEGSVVKVVKDAAFPPVFAFPIRSGAVPMLDKMLDQLPDETKLQIADLHKRGQEAKAEKKKKAGANAWVSDPPSVGIDPEGPQAAAIQALGSGYVTLNQHRQDYMVVTDPALIAEYLPDAYAARIDAYEKEKVSRSSTSSGTGSGGGGGMSDAEKAAAAKQREKDAKARKTGRAFNLDLGVAISRLGEAKVTTEAVKLLVSHAIDSEFTTRYSYNSKTEYEGTGLATFDRLLRPDLPTKKNGETIYPRKPKGELAEDVAAVKKRIDKELAAAKTPEQALGVYARFLALGLADLTGLPNADLEGMTVDSRTQQGGAARAWVTKLMPAGIKKRIPAENGIKGRSQGL